MNKNLQFLLLGAFIFLAALIIRSQQLLSDLVTTIILVISLIIVIVPLYKLVFKSLKK